MQLLARDGRGSGASQVVLGLLAAQLAALTLLNLGPVFGLRDDVNAVLSILLGLALTLTHGAVYLGRRRLLAFLGITVAISFSAEAIGVATGLVFGPYHYTENLGPRLLGVPLMIQVAYVAMGYASLVTARVLVGMLSTPRGWRVLGLTIATALVMVAWDVAMDPYQSTIAGDWIWETGGAYFGVPLHNYAGWFATVAAFVFVYLMYERLNPLAAPAGLSQGRFFQSAPVLYYALIGLGVVITPVLEQVEKLATPNNYTGSIDAMTHSLSLIAIFTMGTPAALALVKLACAPPTMSPPPFSVWPSTAAHSLDDFSLQQFDVDELGAESLPRYALSDQNFVVDELQYAEALDRGPLGGR